jgi:hypothetical protein
MAVTITPVAGSATPYSKKLTITDDGSGVATVFTIADFMTHLAEGPLKETLRRKPTTTISEFNIDQAKGKVIRIYIVASTPALGVDAPSSRYIYWVDGANQNLAGLSCLVTSGIEQTGEMTIEIRLNHSTQA